MQSGLVADTEDKSRSAGSFWACCAVSRAFSNSGRVLRRGDLQRGETRGESGRASLSRSESVPDAAARSFSRPDSLHLCPQADDELIGFLEGTKPPRASPRHGFFSHRLKGTLNHQGSTLASSIDLPVREIGRGRFSGEPVAVRLARLIGTSCCSRVEDDAECVSPRAKRASAFEAEASSSCNPHLLDPLPYD